MNTKDSILPLTTRPNPRRRVESLIDSVHPAGIHLSHVTNHRLARWADQPRDYCPEAPTDGRLQLLNVPNPTTSRKGFVIGFKELSRTKYRTMAESATKQETPSFVGASKVIQTPYPVSEASIDDAMGSLLIGWIL